MSSIRPAAETHVSLAPARPEGTALWLLIVVMAGVILPLIALCQVIAYYRPNTVDDQLFGYYGWRILHGGTVYLDVWDNKPPGIFWTNALGFLIGQDGYLGVLGLCAAALVLAHTAFFVIAATVYARGAAAVTTILLSFFVLHGYYSGGTNRTETFVVVFELVAVAFYMRGLVHDRWWKWYVAGLLCGGAFLYKQVGLAAWGCMGLHTVALVISGVLPWRSGLKRCLLLLVGAATTIGIAAAVLAWQGALREAYFTTVGFNNVYFARERRFPYSIINWVMLSDEVRPVLLLPLLMALAAVIHAFLWWLRPKFRPVEIEQALHAVNPCPLHVFFFATWFLVAFYGALVSPHGFKHYLVPSIPPLILLAGYLINVVRAEARLLRRLQERAWVTAAFVVMGYFAWDAIVRQFEEVSKVLVFRFEQHQAPEWEVVGDAVAHWTQPGDRIQCWGYMPGVYLRARRLNATRFVGPVRGKAPFIIMGTDFFDELQQRRLMDEMEAGLQAAPPAALVLYSDDYLRMTHGDRYDTAPHSRLGSWIDEHYRLVQEIPLFSNVYIFKRADLLSPAESQAIRPQT